MEADLPISVVTPREGDASGCTRSRPRGRPARRPFTHVQRTEYVAQDDTIPQWARPPSQRVYGAPRFGGSYPTGGGDPWGHRGIPVARAPLPPRACQKGMVLEHAHTSV